MPLPSSVSSIQTLSRFKRFKGLGFEAELWEDKQKEAADLIDRLKSVVSIYTAEVVMGNVERGRMSDRERWVKVWQLYEDLVSQHNTLGQKIDFSELKQKIDRYFFFDMCINLSNSLARPIQEGKNKAAKIIQGEFPGGISDIEAYNKRREQNNFESRVDEAFKFTANGNLAEKMLDLAETAKRNLKDNFDIEIEFDADLIKRLKRISNLYVNRPVVPTDELNAWADGRE
ncbi:hypothetical protein ACLJYM_10720 [Rhizobium giardinii]|uniref:hypothetical protein n=1 Tax=Rhizobium giardinii TaxID=56731 RepID=UPI0039E1D71B